MALSTSSATIAYQPANSTSSPSADRNVTFATSGSRTGSGFAEEFRILLRSRLILVHVLALAYVLLLAALSQLIPAGIHPSNRPDQGEPSRLALPLAESMLGAVIIWSSGAMSIRALRMWEVIHFGTHAAFHAVMRFDLLASAQQDANDADAISIGFRGISSLLGPTTLILAYGVLIPNTRRRSLVGVIALALAPFAALATTFAVNPVLAPHGIPLAIQSAANLIFPAAIAVFAATRAAALQRRAFDAERRVEQLGQYTLREKLGSGGMGDVYRADHALLRRPCAIKLIRPDRAGDPASLIRFEREVQATAALAHPHIVRIHDYGRADDGTFYCVMEYLLGITLDELVRRHGPLLPNRTIFLLRQLCSALGEAHDAGLIHRDVKPGNIIVRDRGRHADFATLLDFGLVVDHSGGGEGVTREGSLVGTPAFMAPEQAAGEAVDRRTDLYAVGAVGYYLLSGRPPFCGGSTMRTIAAVLTETPLPLVGIPAELADLVFRCLAKNPAARFVDAGELDCALARCPAFEWTHALANAWWTERAQR